MCIRDRFTVKRVWVATDWCGNQAVTYQLIVINDSEKPVLHNLPDATVEVACSELVPALPALPPVTAVSYTHLRAHETVLDLVCRLLLEKKNKTGSHITWKVSSTRNRTATD